MVSNGNTELKTTKIKYSFKFNNVETCKLKQCLGDASVLVRCYEFMNLNK